MLTSQVAIFLQRLVDDLFQLWRGVRVYPHRWYRRSIQDRIKHRACRVAPERQGARTHLVQHRTKRKEIGAGVQFLSPDLLGRHVGDRSQRTAGTRQMFLGLDGRGAQGNALRLERDLCQPEIENLRLSSIRDEDVRGLDVPMDDTLR